MSEQKCRESYRLLQDQRPDVNVVNDQEKPICKSAANRARVHELKSRFGLEQPEYLARAMRINIVMAQRILQSMENREAGNESR